MAECETGQLLTHDHIVPVSPLQRAGELQYFEMPYVGDERLDQLLEKGPLPRARALSILRSLALALDYAHGVGVLHGAMRPSKVHLLPTGRCQLSGFMLRAGATPVHEALAPGAIGDPAYMAPEQRLDSPELDGRADQYALAVIAAEVLLGARPVVHGKSGLPEVLPVSSWLPSLAEVDPEGADLATTRSTIDAIHRALLSKPELRFPSAAAFVEALSRPLTGEHHALAVPVPPPLWRTTLVRRVLLLLALLAALWYVPTVTRQAWRRAFGSVLVQPGDALTLPR
jgi:serine/threonine protein kinase